MKYGANVYFNDRPPVADEVGYRAGDPLRLSSTVVFPTADDPEGAAEVVFQVLNADDRPNADTERSVDMGDVVKIIVPPDHEGGTGYFVWFSCEPTGWRVIDEPQI